MQADKSSLLIELSCKFAHVNKDSYKRFLQNRLEIITLQLISWSNPFGAVNYMVVVRGYEDTWTLKKGVVAEE